MVESGEIAHNLLKDLWITHAISALLPHIIGTHGNPKIRIVMSNEGGQISLEVDQ